MLWAIVSFPSRLAGRVTHGEWTTLCRLSLRPDAPMWLRVVAAAAEWAHPGHMAWTTDTPPMNE